MIKKKKNWVRMCKNILINNSAFDSAKLHLLRFKN